MSHDHDPGTIPRRDILAQKLMAPELWDCVNEDAPFGSDEGADAYYEYRAWRSQNPNAPLVTALPGSGTKATTPTRSRSTQQSSPPSSGSSSTRGALTPMQSHLLARRSAGSWKMLTTNAPPSCARSKKQWKQPSRLPLCNSAV